MPVVENRKFSARVICLFLSAVVFSVLISYYGLTRATEGRAFRTENVSKKLNFSHVKRGAQYRREIKDVSLSSKDRRNATRSRSGERHV